MDTIRLGILFVMAFWSWPARSAFSHLSGCSRTWTRVADALQDAGCDHPDVLVHCRGGSPHVRGCWVIDLVLGLS